MSIYETVCVMCGATETQEAHVKDRTEFTEQQQAAQFDRDFNIIELCHSHHNRFDDGQIKLCPCRREAVIATPEGDIRRQFLEYPINIKTEYIEWKNARAVVRVTAEEKCQYKD